MSSRVLALALASLGVAVCAQEAAPKSVALQRVEFKTGAMRPGWDFAGRVVGTHGWRAKVGADAVVFVDMNADGKLAVEEDGLALPPCPFVVPIPESLLLASGQFGVSFGGVAEVRLAREDLGAAERLVPDSAIVTRLRVRAGVRPIALDPKASADCEKHCNYLKIHGLADGSAGMASHSEDSKREGYSPEGAVAARGSDLAFAEPSYSSAVLGWHATSWHGLPILDPEVRRFGGAFLHRVAMFYPVARGPASERPFVHPADGATEVPVAFGARGEIPNPVPGTRYAIGCGFPILAKLPRGSSRLLRATVTDSNGARVAGTTSCPKAPANREWPTNSGCALFIPARPLAPTTRYAVLFEFADKTVLEWSFTTAGR